MYLGCMAHSFGLVVAYSVKIFSTVSLSLSSGGGELNKCDLEPEITLNSSGLFYIFRV